MAELRTNHSEMAVFGLIYIAFGIICIFLFIAYRTGVEIPSILEYKSSSLGLLIMGAVNLVNAWGVLSRKRFMWSITLTFLIVQFAGCALGFFFVHDSTRVVLCIVFAICGLYLFSTPSREWYCIE